MQKPVTKAFRPAVYKIVVSFLISVFFLLSNSFPSHAQNTTAKIIREKNIPIIILNSKNGDYYQLGKAHGELIASTEKNAAKNMKKFINRQRMFFNDMDLEYLIGKVEKQLPERYRKEMQGFADGIDGKRGGEITYKDILFINLAGDVTRARTMCTGVALSKNITADKNIILGRNLDWIDGGNFHRVSVVTIFKIKNISFASFGLSGVSTVTTGLNKHGVFVAVLSAIRKKDLEFLGHDSVIFTTRTVLERAKNIKEAAQILKNRHFPYSCIFLLGDKNNAVILEKSGKKTAIRKFAFKLPAKQQKPNKVKTKEQKIKNNVLLTTNHYKKLKLHNYDEDSKIRYTDLERELKTLSLPLGVQSAEKLLTLCKNKNHPVYQRLTKERINRFSTLFSIIVKPAQLKTWIWFARKIPAEQKPRYQLIDFKRYF